jgi:membrane protease YdiL (CAAX protease family)
MGALDAKDALILPGRRLLGVVGAWIAMSAVLGGATAALAHHRFAAAPIVVLDVYVAFLASAWLVLGRDLGPAVALRSAPVRSYALGVVALAVAYAVVMGVESVIPHAWQKTVHILAAMGSDDARLSTASPMLTAVILLRACAVAPLAEELFFRGALFTWLRRHASAPLTVALTSAAFATIHGFPAILPLAFALGVALGIVRERFRSTWPAVVAHVVHNVLMVAFARAATGWTAHLPAWG